MQGITNVKEGDQVVIHTCHGEDGDWEYHIDGKREIDLYWNLDGPIWQKEMNEIAILHISHQMEYGIDAES